VVTLVAARFGPWLLAQLRERPHAALGEAALGVELVDVARGSVASVDLEMFITIQLLW